MVTHSLKKMKQEDRDIALNPMQFRKAGSADFIDIRTLDETDEEVFNSIYYKEVPIVTGGLDETLIVTYSLKYKAYQQKSGHAKSSVQKRSSTLLVNIQYYYSFF